jgi:hypothetical protein
MTNVRILVDFLNQHLPPSNLLVEVTPPTDMVVVHLKLLPIIPWKEGVRLKWMTLIRRMSYWKLLEIYSHLLDSTYFQVGAS